MRIGLAGTMSVGKTTLAKALSELDQFKDYTIQTERSKYLSDLGIPLNTDSTLRGQFIFLAERASELLRDKVITDRTVIDVMAFTRLAESIPYYIGDEINQSASHLISEYDYIFYISPEGVEIEDNGVRTTDTKYRDKVDFEIQSILRKYPHKIKNFTVLTGTTEERIQKVEQALSL